MRRCRAWSLFRSQRLAPVAAPARGARSRWCINLWRRRQRLPRWLRPELGEQADQRCGLFIGQVGSHDANMGSFTNPREPSGRSLTPPGGRAALLDKSLDRWSQLGELRRSSPSLNRFNRLIYCRFIMVPGEGFEPPTFGCEDRCSGTLRMRERQTCRRRAAAASAHPSSSVACFGYGSNW